MKNNLIYIFFLDLPIKILCALVLVVITVISLSIWSDAQKVGTIEQKEVLCSTPPIAKSVKDNYTTYVCDYKN